MKKKTIAGLIALVAIVVAVMLGGCIDGIIQPTPTPAPTATPTPAITPVPTPEINEERELVKQWLQQWMVMEGLDEDDDGEFLEEATDAYMESLKTWNAHPVEIYRGSLIIYESSYGYIHFPEMDEERLQLKGYGETEYKNLVREKGGTVALIGKRDMGACFPTLREAEDFLAELWNLS